MLRHTLILLCCFLLRLGIQAQTPLNQDWTVLGNQSLSIKNGIFVFNKTAAGSDNRAFRQLPTTLVGFPWVLSFECQPTSLHNSTGASIYVALTANANDPQCLPFAQTGDALSWTNNTVLRTTFDNEYEAGEQNCGFNLLYRKEKPMNWANRKWAYTAPTNRGVYYVKMERTTQTNVVLNIYDDAAHTHNISGTPINISVPAEVDSFNYIQVGAYNEGITTRIISGTVSSIQLTTTIGLSPKIDTRKRKRKRNQNQGMQR